MALKRFSRFLAAGEPPTARPEDIDRALLERYLGSLAQLPLAESTKVLSRVFLRGFLEENRRYGWVPTIPVGATIYPEELSGRRRALPRFIPEFVMGHLDSTENLARLRQPYRSLIVLIAETGIFSGGRP